MFDHTLTQQEVLLPAAGQRARRPRGDTSSRDGLPALELFECLVEFHTAGQPVPPVETVLGPVKVHLADHEVTAEDVVDDQGGDVAVPPGRVVRLPAGWSSGEQVSAAQPARRALSRSRRFQGVMPPASQPPLTSQTAQAHGPGARPGRPGHARIQPNGGRIVIPDREINCPSAGTWNDRSLGRADVRGQRVRSDLRLHHSAHGSTGALPYPTLVQITTSARYSARRDRLQRELANSDEQPPRGLNGHNEHQSPQPQDNGPVSTVVRLRLAVRPGGRSDPRQRPPGHPAPCRPTLELSRVLSILMMARYIGVVVSCASCLRERS